MGQSAAEGEKPTENSLASGGRGLAQTEETALKVAVGTGKVLHPTMITFPTSSFIPGCLALGQ